VTDRLHALAARWSLDDQQSARLERVLAVLADDERAPSSVRDESAIDVHVADSLSALALACVREAHSIADLGSGAGFPGIVLAVALPAARVALVESAARKCAFLERLCAQAGIANAVVVHARAEEWRAVLGACDLVVARALAALAVLCEYAAPLLRVGGSLVAWKGAVGRDEADAGARAARALGLDGGQPVRAAPYAGSVAHQFFVYRKLTPTPPGFPRRPGVARRRPLGTAD